MTWNRGDVVMVDFPFVDQTGSKYRPALVLSSTAFHKERTQDVIVCVISTKIEKYKGKTDFPLKDWQKAGLTQASVVRCTLLTILAARINRKVGTLSRQDLQGASKCLKLSLELN